MSVLAKEIHMVFLTVGLMIQPLTYIFARFWLWMLNLQKGTVGYRKGMWAVFLFSNGMFLSWYILIRFWSPILKVAIGWSVVLLFTLFCALSIAAVYFILKKVAPNSQPQTMLRVLGGSLFAGLFGISIYNAYTPVVRHLEITLDRPMAKPVRIGMVSDLHIGRLLGSRQLEKLADMMNREKVDIILMPGDIMDDDVEAYRAENMQPALMKLKAPLGVYATMGNHDLLRGAEREINEELTRAGIQVMNDEVLEVDNGNFWLVGRPDNLAKGRMPTNELLLKTDGKKPVFLMDHRPSDIEAHSKLPIDLQVSGHVHKGQIFPANLLAEYVNRRAYGYEKIGFGHYVVTSGYGFWGVPLRLGSQAEVWVIDVKGKSGSYSRFN